MLVRKESTAGTIRLDRAQPLLSSALRGEYVGYEEVEDGIWAVYFYDKSIAHYDMKNLRCLT